MTIGIYKLTFADGSFYIGKSINIEKRYYMHKYDLLSGTSSKKLLEAFQRNDYSPPSLEILELCSIDNLESLEIQYINKLDAVNIGLNTVYWKQGVHWKTTNSGLNASNAKLSKQQYLDIVDCLSGGKTIKQTAKYLGIGRGIIVGIKTLATHSWLYDEKPEQMLYLSTKYNIGKNTGVCSYEHKYGVAAEIISPEGILFKVPNINKFAREHNLDSGNLYRLIVGEQKSHKGWVLPNTSVPKVISPEGIVYIVPINGATRFAKEHDLENSGLSKLLKQRIKTHRGWKLYINDTTI